MAAEKWAYLRRALRPSSHLGIHQPSGLRGSERGGKAQGSLRLFSEKGQRQLCSLPQNQSGPRASSAGVTRGTDPRETPAWVKPWSRDFTLRQRLGKAKQTSCTQMGHPWQRTRLSHPRQLSSATAHKNPIEMSPGLAVGLYSREGWGWGGGGSLAKA